MSLLSSVDNMIIGLVIIPVNSSLLPPSPLKKKALNSAPHFVISHLFIRNYLRVMSINLHGLSVI